MTDREFWQAVYVAAIHAGYSTTTAAHAAQSAVLDLRAPHNPVNVK